MGTIEIRDENLTRQQRVRHLSGSLRVEATSGRPPTVSVPPKSLVRVTDDPQAVSVADDVRVRRHRTDEGDADDRRSLAVSDPDAPVSVVVVEAVAALRGVDAAALESELNGVVDPDALDALFSKQSDGSERDGGRLSFDYEGCRVTVSTGGSVRVEREGESNTEITEPSTEA